MGPRSTQYKMQLLLYIFTAFELCSPRLFRHNFDLNLLMFPTIPLNYSIFKNRLFRGGEMGRGWSMGTKL
jgi:hypothetical protein